MVNKKLRILLHLSHNVPLQQEDIHLLLQLFRILVKSKEVSISRSDSGLILRRNWYSSPNRGIGRKSTYCVTLKRKTLNSSWIVPVATVTRQSTSFQGSPSFCFLANFLLFSCRIRESSKSILIFYRDRFCTFATKYGKLTPTDRLPSLEVLELS